VNSRSPYTRENVKAQHVAAKDAQFRRNRESGQWPQDTCERCAAGGKCCQSAHHHLYDCCTHCGNDERNPRKVGYR